MTRIITLRRANEFKGDSMGRTTEKRKYHSYEPQDYSIRCHGCKLLFAGRASYLDHVPCCEKLVEVDRKEAMSGELIQKDRFKEMMKHAKDI